MLLPGAQGFLAFLDGVGPCAPHDVSQGRPRAGQHVVERVVVSLERPERFLLPAVHLGEVAQTEVDPFEVGVGLPGARGVAAGLAHLRRSLEGVEALDEAAEDPLAVTELLVEETAEAEVVDAVGELLVTGGDLEVGGNLEEQDSAR